MRLGKFSCCLASTLLVVAMVRLAQAAPVYDAESKSYFEMVDGRNLQKNVYDEGPTWPEALTLAKQRSYKGVAGRLAIVKDLATHDFLERTFQPGSYVWIGLRYWCAAHKLQWSDGETPAPNAFGAWDKNWRQDVYACAGNTPGDFMPIAYSPIEAGFRWIGKGSGKRYYFYFVEYPAGHP